MAKESPWFKFKVNAWNTGDIHLLSYHLKGVFADLCSYYWSKECQLKAPAQANKVPFGSMDRVSNSMEESVVEVDGYYYYKDRFNGIYFARNHKDEVKGNEENMKHYKRCPHCNKFNKVVRIKCHSCGENMNGFKLLTA